jgi:hypothetical protein
MPSQPQAESDNSYTGFASRLDPGNLPAGILQAAQNIRLQRGVAQPRKGCQRLTSTDLNDLTMVGSAVWIDSDGRDNIVLIFTSSMYLYRPTQAGQPAVLLGPYNFPTSRAIAFGGIVDAVQALNKLYIFRGQADSTIFTASVTNPIINVSATGTVTVTTTTPHGYSTGNEVTIRSTTYRTQSALDGNYVITVTGASTFTYQFTNTTGVSFAANTALTGFTTVRGKPPLIWDSNTLTFTAANQKYTNPTPPNTALTQITESVPPADFGIYFQNRLIVKIENQKVAFSDILSERFDLAVNVYYVNQGGNDSIVGFLPWIESQFLVFMKNSIYLAYFDPRSNLTTQSDKSQITVVTTQLGCLARRTIVNAGQYVLFLSAKGVYLLTPQLDLKVIGNTMPLSEPIADFFENLDYSIVQNSVANYYDNRFYIAVPIVEQYPSEFQSRNNRILVYNLLNKNWESIDVYPRGLNADNLIVSLYQYQRRLFILTNFNGSVSGQFGGVFLEGERENGDIFQGGEGATLPFNLPEGLNAGGVINKIESFVTTREFTFDSLAQKRYSRAEFQFNNALEDSILLHAGTRDPDEFAEILNFQFAGTADGTLRPRIALRGSSIAFVVYFTHGRPSLKGVTVHAITASRPMISQE